MEKIKLVPKLRFPEFEESWKEYKLSDFLTRYSETNKDEEFTLNDILSLSSQHGIVSREELLEEAYSNVNHLNYKKTRLNDLVYGKSISASYPYGLFKVNDFKDGLLSTLYFTFKVKSIIDPKFLDCYFSHSTRANNFLKQFVLVGDRYITVDADFLLSGQIHIPTQIKEQLKITSFFVTIETKLRALKRKKEFLEQYRKGVMQKIFTQELRLKDDNGNEFPDWEFKQGNELFISISDKKHNSDLPILAISQEYGAVPRESINYEISVTEKSVDGYKVVKKGDFIISLRSFQGGIEYSNFTGICSPAYIILRSKNPIIDLFYKFYFKTPEYIKQLCSKLEGIRDGKMISYKYFSETILPYPSLEEQKRISDYLILLENKLNITNSKIQNIESWKKGLLQQLFV